MAIHVKAVLHCLQALTPGGHVRHHLPVVTAPPVEQHQAVGGKAVGLVIGLEVIFWVWNISGDIGRQQHIGVDVAVRAVHKVGVVHSREREMGIRQCVQVQTYLPAGTQRHVLQACGHGVRLLGIRTDEEQALGMDMATRVEQGQLVHAWTQHTTGKTLLHHIVHPDGVSDIDIAAVHQRHADELTSHRRGG